MYHSVLHIHGEEGVAYFFAETGAAGEEERAASIEQRAPSTEDGAGTRGVFR